MRLPAALCTIVVLTVLVAAPAFAGTYYIDFAGGSDSNSGTSNSSPWQRCPGMPGFTGRYSHAAGDRFIFKGGVTWTTGFLINTGGSAAASDYYGVDPSWFAGSAWSRPVLNAQRGSANLVRFAASANYVVLDNFDIKGTQATATGADASVMLNGNHHVTIKNCWIHDWTTTVPNTGGFDDGQWGGIRNQWYANQAAIDDTLLITNCDIGNPERGVGGAAGGGGCLFAVGQVAFCKIHDAPQGLLTGGISFHDNEVYNINFSFDTQAHTNVLYLADYAGARSSSGVVCYVYNNYIHDCQAPEIIYPNNTGYGTRTYCIYNNVMMNCNQAKCLDIDPYSPGPGQPWNVYIYNNTFQTNGSIRNSNRPGYNAPNLVRYFNNHIIGTGSLWNEAGSPVEQGNNISQSSVSAASAAGYSAANFFAPTLASGPTIGAGTNLTSQRFPGLSGDTSRGGNRQPSSRPASGAWNAGAYQFGGTPLPSPSASPTPVPTATPTPTPAGQNPSPTPTPNPTPAPTATPASTPGSILSLSFEAGDGVITPPFVVNRDGTVSQPVQTTDPTLAGKAVYTFMVTDAGNYAVTANITATTEGTNSLFVNVDADVAAPTMIWDVGVTTGFEQRIAGWRGTGTDVVAQFSPKIFTLSQGLHQLIIRGREANTGLGHITVMKVPEAPINLRPAG